MEFQELSIPGVWLLTPTLIRDERGIFRRSFCTDEFAAHGIAPQAVQGNISVNSVKGTMRGFHYQQEPHGEAKTLTCVTGAIFNVVVDVRRDSPTFMRSEGIVLDAVECRSIHVPKGCANAYLTLEHDTIIHYYMSERYAPGAARGFRYDDPAFGISWPMPPEVISAKDLAYELFNVDCL